MVWRTLYYSEKYSSMTHIISTLEIAQHFNSTAGYTCRCLFLCCSSVVKGWCVCINVVPAHTNMPHGYLKQYYHHHHQCLLCSKPNFFWWLYLPSFIYMDIFKEREEFAHHSQHAAKFLTATFHTYEKYILYKKLMVVSLCPETVC